MKRNDSIYNESYKKSTLKDYIVDFIDTVKAAELPYALAKLRNKRIFFSIFIILVSVALAILIKKPSALCGVAISLYFVFYALKTTYDYEMGRISEHVLFCINSNNSAKDKVVGKVLGGTKAVFMDKDGDTHTLFYPCNSKKDFFLENAEYIVYIHDNNPKTIIAYENK